MGTISWDAFTHGLKHILSISESISDGWTLYGNLDKTGSAYLGKKIATQIPGSLPNSIDPANQVKSSDYATTVFSEEEDSSCLSIDPTALTSTKFSEFHIIYNEAYSVPTLYFRSWLSDGSTVAVEEMWREFESKQAFTSSWDVNERLRTLTQQEHPFSGEPWFLLHPCRTAQFMSLLSKDDQANNYSLVTLPSDELYMVRWLSTMAPLVGCPISQSYAKKPY